MKVINKVKMIAFFITRVLNEVMLAAAFKLEAGIKKGYSPESLKRFYDKAKRAIDFYMDLYKKDPRSIKACITNGNRKIGPVMNISLLPLFTCISNCEICKFYCYDVKACLQYANVMMARVRNTVLLWYDEKEYFHQIESKISRRRKNFFFRWHVAGDIISESYFSYMVELAVKYPKFRFWCYTKQYKLINNWCNKHGVNSIPDNLVVMFSKWNGVKMDNPYNFPVFGAYDKSDFVGFSGFKCPGNCQVCINNKCGCIYAKKGDNIGTEIH